MEILLPSAWVPLFLSKSYMSNDLLRLRDV